MGESHQRKAQRPDHQRTKGGSRRAKQADKTSAGEPSYDGADSDTGQQQAELRIAHT
jgi:hypothetical protein